MEATDEVMSLITARWCLISQVVPEVLAQSSGSAYFCLLLVATNGPKRQWTIEKFLSKMAVLLLHSSLFTFFSPHIRYVCKGQSLPLTGELLYWQQELVNENCFFLKI